MSKFVEKIKEAVGTGGSSHDNPQKNSRPGFTNASNSSSQPVHQNEMANKIDPRVNKNPQWRDGGLERAEETPRQIDPQDASHVPPSVLAQHVGGPHVQHDYPHDSTAKRHSVSHQEQHLMR